ncbi:hypothetical protein EV174_004213 [Coemansia sp. RSA 2320]|nr:hypothetical protein EV174_004213 [Coemansia sp. RSA 2320]
MADFPSIVYVATPFTMCFGALLTPQTVITDARCLFPFSNTSAVAAQASGTLQPDYLMVALPTVNTSATMHNILLSTQVYTTEAQAGFRATTFLSLVASYVDNSTFYAVNTSAVHAYYPQSQDSPNAQQNFDVGIVTLKVPIKNAQLATLQLDDLGANAGGLTAISFAPPNTSNDAAVQQVLYQGMDLTKIQITPVSSLKRSECDSDFMNAYGLRNMESFQGHGLPDNNSPIYCSQMYANTTQCTADTSISISKSGSNVNSVSLNSTIWVFTSGSSVKVVGLGRPHLFEVRSSPSGSCRSNGFVYIPRTGIYTDWIGWATRGSIASSGSWVNKTMTGDDITDFINNSNASSFLTHITALMSAAAAIFATILIAA